MAQEIDRVWEIKDGPPLSELVASLMASGDYLPEFKLFDRQTGTTFYCRAKVVSLSHYSPSRHADPRTWYIIVQSFNCTTHDQCRSRLAQPKIAPSAFNHLRGDYTFGSGRTGSLTLIPEVEEDE